MKISLTSIMVNDQEKAHKFYTEKLGFETVVDFPVHGARWISLKSPEGAHGIELGLEPAGFEFAQQYQKALYENGVPITAFEVNNLDIEMEKLKDRGVKFHGDVMSFSEDPRGTQRLAMLDDTVGNYIMIYEVTPA